MTFHLRSGQTIVGQLEVVDQDFPWLYCKLIPTEHDPSFKIDLALFASIQEADELKDIEEEAFDRIWFQFNQKYHVMNDDGRREELAIVWIENGIFSLRGMDIDIFQLTYEEYC